MNLITTIDNGCAFIKLPDKIIGKDYLQAFSATVQKLGADDDIACALITPETEKFPSLLSPALCLSSSFVALSAQFAQDLRTLETLGKPIACALPQGAKGIGLEIALSCHYRFASSDKGGTYAFPEVNFGLIPAHGGIQRLIRFIGIEQALPLLTTGKSFTNEQALELGIIDACLANNNLYTYCQQQLAASKTAKQAWDEAQFAWRGNAPDSLAVNRIWMITPAMVRQKTGGHYPAPDTICTCIYEGSRLGFAEAVANDQRRWQALLHKQATRNTLQVAIDKSEIEIQARATAKQVEKISTVGVVGAGMMGAGIAIVSICAGYKVVVYDVSQGKIKSLRKRLDKHLTALQRRGVYQQEQVEVITDGLKTVSGWEEFAKCELVIEAVFEDRELKEKVYKELERVLPAQATIASNTSTLPITSLAKYTQRAQQFIGLHFFSPVERMQLVEIIKGKDTQQQTIDLCFAYVANLRKIPVLVEDGRSFYTSRVFMTYLLEGMILLQEGQAPQLIERAGKHAGMPVPPLALADEISLELIHSIFAQTIADGASVSPYAQKVVERMYKNGRLGRKAGKGFYEYHERDKTLWSGLQELFPSKTALTVEEMAERFLYVQVAEAARCMQDNIVHSVRDANVGSVLGWGFPAMYGGVLQYALTCGGSVFLEKANVLTQKYGERFQTTAWLQRFCVDG